MRLILEQVCIFWQFLTQRSYAILQLQTNLPVFRVKESCVRRRYSDFDWLRGELERDSKVIEFLISDLVELYLFSTKF